MADKRGRWVTAERAIAALEPTDTVLVGMVEPQTLTYSLRQDARRLSGLRVIAWPLLGTEEYAIPEFDCRVMSAGKSGALGQYVPIRIGDIKSVVVAGCSPPTATFVHVSTPDPDGWCSFGIAGDYTYDAALASQGIVIAEVNDQMPRISGEARIHTTQCDYLVKTSSPLPERALAVGGASDRAIGELIAHHVPPNATLQVGIGKLPGAALRSLAGRVGLGIQSGVIDDAVMELSLTGVVDGPSKASYPNQVVTSCVFGSARLYAWAHDNPKLRLMPSSWIYDPSVLASDPRFTSINTALQVDITGQVNAESIAGRQIGNAGGLATLHRAAFVSEHGRAIIAIRSRTNSGASAIVANFDAVDPVTNLRSDADIFVTEFGGVSVAGDPISTRAHKLVTLAHPETRSALLQTAHDRGIISRASDTAKHR